MVGRRRLLATGGLARNGCVRLEELTSDTLGACRVHFRLFPATPLAHALTNVGGGMYVPYPLIRRVRNSCMLVLRPGFEMVAWRAAGMLSKLAGNMNLIMNGYTATWLFME